MSAAAVIVRRRKRLVRRFREAGAVDAAHAVTLRQAGVQRSWIFEQMIEHGAFIATEDGRYFLNEAAAQAFMAARRKQALIVGGILSLVFVLIWLLALIGR